VLGKCLECKNFDICNRILTICEEFEDPPYSKLKAFEPINNTKE